MCKNLWSELNPRVRCDFGNVSMNIFIHLNLPASFAGPRHGRRQGKGLCYRLQFLISFQLNTIISNLEPGTIILTFKQHFTSVWCNYRRSSCLSRNCPVLSLLGYEGFNWNHRIEDFRFLLFRLSLAEVEYSTDIMQLLEMTGMTETVGMVPITNLDEPGGFRIGKVRKILDFRILLKYVYNIHSVARSARSTRTTLRSRLRTGG